jgi:hypothetical protein
MRTHRPIERPWDQFRLPPAWSTALPGLGDLDNEPQVGPVAGVAPVEFRALAFMQQDLRLAGQLKISQPD